MLQIHKTSPPPWKSGGNTIQTFPSGLLRVDQEYVVPTETASEFYNTFPIGQELADIASPAVDGVFVFPQPQYKDNGNGLTTINVSAFGRTAPYLGNLTKTARLLTVFEQVPFSIGFSVLFVELGFYVWDLDSKIATRGSTVSASSIFETDSQLMMPFNLIYRISGAEVPFGEQFGRPTITEVSVTEDYQAPEISDGGSSISTAPTAFRDYEVDLGDYVLDLRITDFGAILRNSSSFGEMREYDITTFRRVISSNLREKE